MKKIKVNLQMKRKEGEELKEFFDRFFRKFYHESYEKTYNNVHYTILDPLNAESGASNSMAGLLDKYKELEYCESNVRVAHSDDGEVSVTYEVDRCNWEYEWAIVKINGSEIIFEAEHDLGMSCIE